MLKISKLQLVMLILLVLIYIKNLVQLKILWILLLTHGKLYKLLMYIVLPLEQLKQDLQLQLQSILECLVQLAQSPMD